MKSNKNKHYSINYKSFIYPVSLVLFIVFITTRIDAFEDSISSLRSTNIFLVLVAVILIMFTFIGTALSFKFLTFRKIKFHRLVLVEIANGFVSKLIPAGIGGLALHSRFLYKNHHTLIQAGSIAAMNNIVGFISFLSVFYIANLNNSINQSGLEDSGFHLSSYWRNYVLIIVLLIFLSVISISKLRNKINQVKIQLLRYLSFYYKKPQKLLGSYFSAIIVTLSYVGILYLSALSLGVSLSISETFFAFAIGIFSASITPTPGGVGGAEAGLVAALTAIGVSPSEALSIALLYRLITYWLPLIPGFFVFQYCLKKSYI